jgi:hypothetical protein
MWFFRLYHVRFVPFAFAESLYAYQVNRFAPLLFHEADTFVLYILDSVAHFELRITHTSSVRARRDFRIHVA